MDTLQKKAMFFKKTDNASHLGFKLMLVRKGSASHYETLFKKPIQMKTYTVLAYETFAWLLFIQAIVIFTD